MAKSLNAMAASFVPQIKSIPETVATLPTPLTISEGVFLKHQPSNAETVWSGVTLWNLPVKGPRFNEGVIFSILRRNDLPRPFSVNIMPRNEFDSRSVAYLKFNTHEKARELLRNLHRDPYKRGWFGAPNMGFGYQWTFFKRNLPPIEEGETYEDEEGNMIDPITGAELVPTAIVIKGVPRSLQLNQLLRMIAQVGPDDAEALKPYSLSYLRQGPGNKTKRVVFANFIDPQFASIARDVLCHTRFDGAELLVEMKRMPPSPPI